LNSCSSIFSRLAIDYMLNAKVGYVFFVGWENENLKVDETRIKGIKKWIQIETKKSQFLDFKDFFFLTAIYSNNGKSDHWSMQ
jgi:hypothetical protein